MNKSRVKKPAPKSSARLLLLSLVSGLVALAAVTATINDLGITTDEPHYYDSCLQQIAWFHQAAEDFSKGQWSAPFSPEVLDRHWNFELIYNVHPPFYKLCSSLTLVLFEPWLGTMGAYRFSTAIMFSLLVALLFFTVGRRYGILAGLWAAASFALMPRIFGHAHIGATDMPITLLWFASAISFHRALESRRWAPVFALVYGLALSTKFTALVIPLPLVAYVLVSKRFKEAAWPVGIALVVSPLIMIGMNPQWWHYTFERVYSYLVGSVARSQYKHIPTYYLGRQYSFYLPWHHSLVYTLFTVQPLVLAGFLYGLWRIVRRPFADQWVSHMGIHWLILHLVMMLPSSPGYDGVRLFLPSFAFLAVVSAAGFHHFAARDLTLLLVRLPVFGSQLRYYGAHLILGAMIIPQAVVLARLHPYELCYYNSLAGGISGAHDLGMETTYWWDPVNEKVFKLINDTVPDSSSVYTKDNGIFLFYQKTGKINPSLSFSSGNTEYILHYTRQGAFHDYEWVLYRRGKPLWEIKVDGVRLLALFKRQESLRKIIENIERELEKPNPPAGLHFEEAVIYEALGDNDRMIVELEKYIEKNPRSYTGNMLLAKKFLAVNKPEEAIRVLLQISDNNEDLIDWNFNMAGACYLLGDIDRAIYYYKEIIKIRSLDSEANLKLGQLFYIKKDYKRAKENLKLTLLAEPDNTEALHVLGRINQDLNNHDQAKYYYEKLLRIDPEQVRILLNMGLLCIQEGDTARAEKYYLQALKVDSTDTIANANLGQIYMFTHRADLAEKLFRIVVSKEPENSQAHLSLALIYNHYPDRWLEALAEFRIAAGLIPGSAEYINREFIIPLQNRLASNKVLSKSTK
ncbi:MAG TPA: tetratricopeptide repeat protein [archaeon]|nr:tetratricopeptide repeat protein [archaeon]